MLMQFSWLILLKNLDGAVLDEIPVQFRSQARTGWQQSVTVFNLDRSLQAEIKLAHRPQHFKELAVLDGRAAMEIDEFERMKNGGVQLALQPERFRQMRGLHNRSDSGFPRHVGADNVHDAFGDAVRRRVMA